MILQGLNFGNLIYDERAILEHRILARLRFLYGVSLRGYTKVVSVPLYSATALVEQLNTISAIRRTAPVILGITVSSEKVGVRLRDFALILGRNEYQWPWRSAILVEQKSGDAPDLSLLQRTTEELRAHTQAPLIIGVQTDLSPKHETLAKMPADALCVHSTSPEGDELPAWVVECRKKNGFHKPIIAGGEIAHRIISDLFSHNAEAVLVGSWDAPWRMRKLVRRLDLQSAFETRREYLGHMQKPVKL